MSVRELCPALHDDALVSVPLVCRALLSHLHVVDDELLHERGVGRLDGQAALLVAQRGSILALGKLDGTKLRMPGKGGEEGKRSGGSE